MELNKQKILKSEKINIIIKKKKNKQYIYVILQNKLVLVIYLNKFIILKNNYIFIKNLHNLYIFNKFFKKKLLESNLGFYVDLLIKGIGYSVYLYNKFLYFNLGFSHYISIKIPKLINILKFKKRLVFFSFDKNVLNSFISILLNFRGLDVYKGQGIVDKKIYIKLKEGKKK